MSFSLKSPSPEPHEVSEATLLYHLILDDCEADDIVLRKPSGDGDQVRDELSDTDDLINDDGETDEPQADDDEDEDVSDGSSVPLHKLFRAIYDYCPTPEGQTNVVRIALHGLFPVENQDDQEERTLRRILPRARLWRSFGMEQKAEVYRSLANFASDFLEGFFVPLKAQGRCTPIVSRLITPTTRTEVGPEQGTPNRLSNLRKLCLARDGNRCVVTSKYDRKYLESQAKRPGRKMRQIGIKTEAAHIIPHALNALVGNESNLEPSKRMVWRILNMFDPGISATLSGTLIDTPMNAMILASELHDRFGSLQCYLEAAPRAGADTYTFHNTRGAIALDPSFLPSAPHVVFVNHERSGTPADLPSSRLIALHRACCLMLSMSGAAEYVENLLRDTETLMEKGVLAGDGSSNFALFLRMRGVEETAEDTLEKGMRAGVVAQ